MSKYVAVIALMLVACRQETHVAPQPIADPFTCPSLTPASGYSVKTVQGVDYLICQMRPSGSNSTTAELYIGNFPAYDNGLRFYNFSSSPIGPLAWFSAPESAAQPDRLLTYISTRQRFPAVIKLTVWGSNSRELAAQGEALASMILANRHVP
jgi:hypothetical protein